MASPGGRPDRQAQRAQRIEDRVAVALGAFERRAECAEDVEHLGLPHAGRQFSPELAAFAFMAVPLHRSGADAVTASPTLYMTREKATEFIRTDCGIPIGDSRLGDLVHRGGGPRYSIINGRALYTAKDLLAWIAEQAGTAPREATKRGHAPKKKADASTNKKRRQSA
jgi:hypothetical protein